MGKEEGKSKAKPTSNILKLQAAISQCKPLPRDRKVARESLEK